MRLPRSSAAMIIVRPSMNSGSSVRPRHIRTAVVRKGGSSGCSRARTAECSPSAPISTPASTVVSAPGPASTRTPSSDCWYPRTSTPVRTASAPSRSRTASSSIICNSPRWMEYCGATCPAATPRSSVHSVAPPLLR